MNILIIEDEYHSAARLEHLLKNYDPSVQIAAVLTSAGDSIQWLKENKHPDLIFQDIELNDGNCFEIYSQVDVKVPIVFTTAYSEYALKAFELNSIDYLVKPFDKEDIKKVLDKYSQFQSLFFLQNRRLSEEQLLMNTSSKSRFLVKIGDRYESVGSSDVNYIRFEQGMSFIYLANKRKYPVEGSLSELEIQLDRKSFFRINRKYIVSIDCIQQMNAWFNSRIKLKIVPDPDEDVIVSRDRARHFKKWLNGGE
ncbi:MAG: LytTR family DNA-binding domain-containing protein [Cytophagales bacterium]|nr:LytTR family DNA-binding domain-containing protein [Cytophagales bacterium]